MQVGVIGVGNMGSGIAMNLIDKGYQVTARDIRPEADARVAAHGAKIAPSPKALAAAVDIVIIVVVNAAQIESVLFGADGVFATPATTTRTHVPAIMICSTIAPGDTERFAKGVAGFGATLLDAPISGGPARARDGGMSLMLAASEPARTRFDKLLHDMAARLMFVSNRIGDGARVKLFNNLLGGIQLVAGAQVIAAGERMGLSGETLFKVISASSGQSWVTDDRIPRALAGDFAPRAHAPILTKDVMLGIEMMKSAGEAFPLAEIALQTFKAALDAGWTDKDDCVVLEVARGKAGI